MATKRPARRRPPRARATPPRRRSSAPALLARIETRGGPIATPVARPGPVPIQHFPKKPRSGAMAVEMDRDSPSAHLNMGIALKLKGARGEARTALERARALDPHGPFGSEAERILLTMPDGRAAGSPAA